MSFILYCDRYFYIVACRQQWRRTENIAAPRTCRVYTRVDRHMICSSTKTAVHSATSCKAHVLCRRRRWRRSGEKDIRLPIHAGAISTRISSKRVLPAIMSQHVGHTLIPLPSAAIPFLPSGSSRKLRLINLNRRRQLNEAIAVPLLGHR